MGILEELWSFYSMLRKSLWPPIPKHFLTKPPFIGREYLVISALVSLCVMLAMAVLSPNCRAADSTLSDACEASLLQMRAKEAIENCTRAIEANPKDARSYSNRGAAFLFFNKFTNAVSDLETSARLDETNPKTFYNLGLYYAMMQQYQQAIDLYSKAIVISPGNPIAYFNRAKVLQKLCRNEEALRDFKKVMKIAPSLAKIKNIPTTLSATLSAECSSL
jgi:tetratricopeptide (TPR) repeat protein